MKKFLIIVAFMFLPAVALAQGGNYCGDSGAISSTQLCNPTAKFAGDFEQLLKNILMIFGGAVGAQAIVYVVFAGFRMVVSQGDAEAVATAKASLQWAVLGFLLIMGSFALVYAMSVFLQASPVNPDIDNPDRGTVARPTTAPTFGDFVNTILKGTLGIVGLLAMMMIIINGFRYVTAGGNNEQTESAKSGLQWAVLGLVVTALAYVIVQATWKLLNP